MTAQTTARTYTGPTMGGGRATITCPDWCADDHEYWGDFVDDTFHHSAPVELVPPRDRMTKGREPRPPALFAELMVHSTDMKPSATVVQLHLDEHSGRVVELDLAGVDDLLTRVDAYRDGLARLREQYAAVLAERSRTA